MAIRSSVQVLIGRGDTRSTKKRSAGTRNEKTRLAIREGCVSENTSEVYVS
jgi:hypothetical protein